MIIIPMLLLDALGPARGAELHLTGGGRGALREEGLRGASTIIIILHLTRLDYINIIY